MLRWIALLADRRENRHVIELAVDDLDAIELLPFRTGLGGWGRGPFGNPLRSGLLGDYKCRSNGWGVSAKWCN